MVKNIKQFQKERVKDDDPIAEKDELGNFKYLDIIPATYKLPNDYSIFEEEFKRKSKSLWIMKPRGNC